MDIRNHGHRSIECPQTPGTKNAVEASLPGQGVSAMDKYLAIGIMSAGEARAGPWDAADGV